MTFPSAAIILEKQYRHIPNTNFQSFSYAAFIAYAKNYENNSEAETVNDQSIEFQKMFDLIKQKEEISEPYRAKNSELSDIQILKKVRLGYHAAYFS